jgi:hypothetical protein
VKFGKYVTRSVVKVPEKFGFNWSIFGWFGHFTEHVEGGVLGFRGNGHLRCENPPEGARNLQECSRAAKEHIVQHGFTRFGIGHKGWKWVLHWWHEQRVKGEREREGFSPERDDALGRGHRRADHRRGEVVAGEGWRSPETESQGREQRGVAARPRAREGQVFLKTGYGRTGQRTGKWTSSARQPVHRTLHSAVSGAHRTVR